MRMAPVDTALQVIGDKLDHMVRGDPSPTDMYEMVHHVLNDLAQPDVLTLRVTQAIDGAFDRWEANNSIDERAEVTAAVLAVLEGTIS
jgi:hypothetical protein